MSRRPGRVGDDPSGNPRTVRGQRENIVRLRVRVIWGHVSQAAVDRPGAVSDNDHVVAPSGIGRRERFSAANEVMCAAPASTNEHAVAGGPPPPPPSLSHPEKATVASAAPAVTPRMERFLVSHVSH